MDVAAKACGLAVLTFFALVAAPAAAPLPAAGRPQPDPGSTLSRVADGTDGGRVVSAGIAEDHVTGHAAGQRTGKTDGAPGGARAGAVGGRADDVTDDADGRGVVPQDIASGHVAGRVAGRPTGQTDGAPGGARAGAGGGPLDDVDISLPRMTDGAGGRFQLDSARGRVTERAGLPTGQAEDGPGRARARRAGGRVDGVGISSDRADGQIIPSADIGPGRATGRTGHTAAHTGVATGRVTASASRQSVAQDGVFPGRTAASASVQSAARPEVVAGPVTAVPGGQPSGPGGAPLTRVTEGTLWWRPAGQAVSVPAPMLATDVAMRVTGIVVRAVVRQEFTNPSTAWAEGVYVFPLPEDAAVDHLRMTVGDRVIEGIIEERVAARRTYERAKQQGQRASLIEHERPNVFTASVANIPPGAAIAIEIEYQQVLRIDAGQLRLRFPMVVGPRYIPGARLATDDPARADGSGWAGDTDEVPDASRITPPVRPPALGVVNPVTLRIELDPGVTLARLESPSHRVTTTSLAGDRYVVDLADGAVPADRDFELVWAPRAGMVPAVTVLAESTTTGVFALLMVLPPAPDAVAAQRVPRELVFVIDTSGSMHGASIEQAKAALTLALSRLQPEDRFNVIQFNSRTDALFPAAQPVTAANRELADGYVRGLRAGGGTEMLPALTLALDGQRHQDRLRQVVFLTDGAVGNEERLFASIRERLGESRLFTIGIGSAPNSHFMREAARLGRGTFTYIASTSEVQRKMEALFRKLESPVLTDLELELPGAAPAAMFPTRIPDLYLGEPVLVTLRADALPVRAVLRGRLGPRPWAEDVWLQDVEEGAGLSVHWARAKIAALLDERRSGAPDDDVRAAVIAVALEHHLVSPFTSLVAVDVTPARPASDALERHALETNLPHGWDATAVSGLGQGATAASAHIAIGLTALLAATAIALASWNASSTEPSISSRARGLITTGRPTAAP